MESWERYDQVNQAVMFLDEDVLIDHANDYEATEYWLSGLGEVSLTELVEQIDALISDEPDGRSRMAVLDHVTWFSPDYPQDFDAWLAALRTRAEQALAGDHSRPMVKPPRE